MSYQEKKTITSMFTGAAVLAAYCIHTVGRYQSGALPMDDLKAWAGAMLVFIGIGIVASIVIQIIFHILISISIAIREGDGDDKKISKSIKATVVEDEMDKLIGLKSLRLGYAFAGVGFVAALVTLVLGAAPAVMLNIIFVACSLGSLSEGVLSLHYYRKGV